MREKYESLPLSTLKDICLLYTSRPFLHPIKCRVFFRIELPDHVNTVIMTAKFGRSNNKWKGKNGMDKEKKKTWIGGTRPLKWTFRCAVAGVALSAGVMLLPGQAMRCV